MLLPRLSEKDIPTFLSLLLVRGEESLMSSVTCKNCGSGCSIVDTACPACGRALEQAGSHQRWNQEPGGVPRVPVYGLPDSVNARSAPSPNIWRRGSILAFHKSATLPDRCIRCNDPAHGIRVNKTLSWHHPALYLLIFAGLLIYAIVAMVVRKSARVSVGFCTLHKQERTRMLAAGWLAFGSSLVAFFGAMAEENGYIALVGVALLIAAVVLSLLGGRFINVKKIDNTFVYLRGVHPEYLDQFPPI